MQIPVVVCLNDPPRQPFERHDLAQTYKVRSISCRKAAAPKAKGEIIEIYSHALPLSTKISLDYQFISNPAYNTDRGPVNVFAGRFHWQF